ncbi:hypothetical protein FRC14_005579 [Serendipita sp. 396]|nr:hypothetical protein FRC14_005579 [Serendipita sp. 396]KAG8789246.1 hypothetical protein FRC15_010082 [Serendipita sp. 397]KAG8804463.1 hypothetical protein FRC16_007872 [Serendipita sp. 398]KAG8827572.1 hypothetical protein FRC19_002265 [Serendipita sp. 401]KAG8860666.1 hypothetical protein FRB91_001781 [Serendipita sp. 411]KAG8878424.1 hypothetical protein FRC20_008347 [Serendipita sp. 405]
MPRTLGSPTLGSPILGIEPNVERVSHQALNKEIESLISKSFLEPFHNAGVKLSSKENADEEAPWGPLLLMMSGHITQDKLEGKEIGPTLQMINKALESGCGGVDKILPRILSIPKGNSKGTIYLDEDEDEDEGTIYLDEDEGITYLDEDKDEAKIVINGKRPSRCGLTLRLEKTRSGPAWIYGRVCEETFKNEATLRSHVFGCHLRQNLGLKCHICKPNSCLVQGHRPWHAELPAGVGDKRLEIRFYPPLQRFRYLPPFGTLIAESYANRQLRLLPLALASAPTRSEATSSLRA